MLNIKCSFLLFIFLSISIGHSQPLKSSSNQADYLIISPNLFFETLQPLIDFRTAEGINIRLIDINQIYDEFLDTLTTHEAIQHFISYTLQYWEQPQPKYVLLAGDTDIIPSFRFASMFNDHPRIEEDSVSIDDWYAINIYEEDNIPDIQLGRFPIINSIDLNALVQKTIYFDTYLKRSDYLNDFVFFTDSVDASGFEWAMGEFISTIMPEYYTYDRIDLRFDSPFNGTSTDMINSINEGTMFLSYYGHASSTAWSDTFIFSVDDIDYLEENERPFILTTIACSQNFDDPSETSIVEKLLSSPASGAISTFSSSGLNLFIRSKMMIDEFYSYIFSNPQSTIGEAILYIKRKLITESLTPDHTYHRYTLLGDPAIKFPPDLITRLETKHLIPPDDFKLFQNYPNPFNPSTTIEFTLPKSEYVELNVYNILGKEVATLVSNKLNSGNHTYQFDGKNLASGVYYYQLVAGDYREVKKMILIK
jgi:hypothetical protein